MLNLNRWAIFASAARLQSFSKAAEYLGTSKPTVSKQIATLEETLGTKLFIRSTRSLQLTEAGQALYSHCKIIMTEYENAEDLLENMRNTPSGLLNIGAPVSYIQHALSELSVDFVERYPEINLHYHSHQAANDYFPKDADIAIIIEKLKESSLCYRPLGEARHTLCATPAYIEKHGQPKTLEDLKNFNFLQARYAHIDEDVEWGMSRDGQFHPAQVQGNISVDDSMTVKKMVLDGAGISTLPSFASIDEINQGVLVELLPEYTVGSVPIYAVFPEKKYMPPKVRAYLDALVDYFSNNPQFNTTKTDHDKNQ